MALFLKDGLRGKKVDPFWRTSVMPYFFDARKDGHIEAMAYDVRRSLEDAEVSSWLGTHEKEVSPLQRMVGEVEAGRLRM